MYLLGLSGFGGATLHLSKNLKPKRWHNSKTEFVEKKKKKKIQLWQNSKILLVTKTLSQTKIKDTKYATIQNLKLWPNFKKKSNYDKTQRPNWWQNLKTQIVTKLNHLNCDITRRKKLWQNRRKKWKEQHENLNKIILVATIYTSLKYFMNKFIQYK